MVDAALSMISDEERRLAVDLLNSLMEAVGDKSTRQVSAIDLHRIWAFVAAIIAEADSDLSEGSDFRRLGQLIGELVAYHATTLRLERQQTGMGLIGLNSSKQVRKHH